MFSLISRWQDKRRAKAARIEDETAVRVALEQRVSAQLVELIAYMDRLGISRETTADAQRDAGAPH